MRYLRGIVWSLLLTALISCTPAPVEDAAAENIAPLVVSGSDGVKIAYSLEGNSNAEAAVVLIHGWSCNSTYWDRQIQSLAQDYRIVRLDLPGHGKSGSEREAWTIEAYGEDVAVLVRELGLEQTILVGHSMGGYVALEAARRLPNRVVGIIGVDTLIDAEFSMPAERQEEFLQAWREDFEAACDRFVRAMFGPDVEPQTVRDVAEDMCSGSPEVGLALLHTYLDYDLTAAFEAVAVPIRCINADARETQIEVNRRHAEDFDVKIIEDCGHFPMLERTEQFNALLLEVLEEIL